LVQKLTNQNKHKAFFKKTSGGFMKSLLTTAILALSLNAFAIDANSTWSEIFSSNKVAVQLPQVSFLAGEVTSLVSIDQVCFTSSSIETINTQYTYAHTQRGNESLVVTGQEILKTGLTFNRYLPVGNGDNAPLVAFPEAIPLSYNLVVRAAQNGDHEGRALFTKVYALPACQ
jgi:hypothetical protein